MFWGLFRFELKLQKQTLAFKELLNRFDLVQALFVTMIQASLQLKVMVKHILMLELVVDILCDKELVNNELKQHHQLYNFVLFNHFGDQFLQSTSFQWQLLILTPLSCLYLHLLGKSKGVVSIYHIKHHLKDQTEEAQSRLDSSNCLECLDRKYVSLQLNLLVLASLQVINFCKNLGESSLALQSLEKYFSSLQF